MCVKEESQTFGPWETARRDGAHGNRASEKDGGNQFISTGQHWGTGVVAAALAEWHSMAFIPSGRCELNAESGVKAHVKATGASSAARICHMHGRLSIRVGGFGLGSPSRALVTFHFGTFQQGSEHRNRGEMPSAGHFPSTAGRYPAGGRGAKKEEVGARSGLSPCTDLARTTRRRQLLSNMVCVDNILLPIPHFLPPGIRRAGGARAPPSVDS
ncbi:hypothetical protein GE21DRAFT_4845 [Neurospora crassa]|uniref:Uncharacterized protein n=1 Tax=Neurospora crassa (strain ATCC 24698 / 74-OR23-1A / CBS 708.71 / DSM 1257 / FGSC 987) TaxID=367110 RepID=Q7S2Z0_NEUCR|nr:hypothetical protein NCU08979 [Neurospora crassa OR74A]EAA29771.1 hypothetical protein NCU08979 [Neurospora crassa OR74A]KHE82017.1 hypothetical protein GE21DRAFT_4845 [Neurospora crassa]|eukprot:XP_959007.1 hypothetical protein NCU08979 [Neurospora crassa OR74A]